MQDVKAQQDYTKLNLRTFYFLTFLGIGALNPLLPVYLDETIGLSGAQIGLIMSLSPVVMIVIQPMWGLLSDWTQKPRLLLTIATLLTSLIGIVYSFANVYVSLIIVAITLSMVQSAMIPISDSITLNYVQKTRGNYGSFRLWGAIGFAVAVIIAGRMAETFGNSVIFYIFSAVLFIAALFSFRLPEESQQSVQTSMFTGIKSLRKQKKYMLFLFTTFLILGPILANNSYFGLFVKDIGGTLTGIGLAFLFAAGSEAPFMQFANRFIQKLGMMKVLLIAALISMVRWYFYYFEPSLVLVYATTIAQGFSVGLFIPAALQYVRDIAPKEVRVTAISIYSAVGNGLGSWFCIYVGGLLLEWFSIQMVYLFYGMLTSIGIVSLVIISRLERNESKSLLEEVS
ncbi:MFS transporter [Bacillus suaedaesalsae]|uniref:MFS transporter n=1 Tax=Bacillus suaedaesalsae TaxID=2810349 RepID=UPI001EF5DB3C|nr:MFS transporter [Bacillus suaedaesalsae]